MRPPIPSALWISGVPAAPTMQLTDTLTLTPLLINEFRIAYNRGAVYNWGPDFRKGYPAKLGLNNAVVDAFPNISVAGPFRPPASGPHLPTDSGRITLP